MPQFPAFIELSSSDSAISFKIIGETDGDYSGFSVAGAGDINGDGFDDLLIGAPMGNISLRGASYVVFGKGGGFATTLSLSTLDGTNGFKINGEADTDMSGRSVSGAGDINGDLIDDLLIGAFNADPNGAESGASYVVFGKDTSVKGNFAASLDLSTLTGTNGFQINGVAAGDNSGMSVAHAGDVNGDKIADLIIGAFKASANGDYSGASYVVFGTKAGFSANFQLSSLTGTNGFEISGAAAYDYSGMTVNSAGDINGDGFGDLVIGAKSLDVEGYADGASFIVFGKASGFGSDFVLSSLDGDNGFKIASEAAGDLSGFSVASVGDMNGDKIDDLVIGAFNADPNGLSNSGATYVIFGTKTGFKTASFDLSTLNGTNGFQINGEAAGDYSGRSVSSAGDVNGDKIADLLIGASEADANGANSGASYVLFGKAGGFAANIDLSGLDGTNGFKIKGEAAGDYSGYSVSSAGDVDGDGFGDLLIGAFGADASGLYSGASYVVFGHAGLVDTPGVNDAPAGADKTITVVEDGSYPLTLGDFGFSDVDNNGFKEILITTLPANGTLKLGTAVVQQADRIKASDITDLGLVFKPDDNASGNNYASFQFQVVDDGVFGNGSENVDPTPNTIKFNVTAVNDGAPVLTGTVAVLAAGTEGVAYIIEAVDLLSGFTDADDDLLSVTGLVAGNGALVNNNDGTWTFNPQANYSGAVKLDYTVTDGKGGNTTATNTFNLAGVNDAPAGADKTITVVEDGSHPLTLGDFGFSDIDNNGFKEILITTLPANGTLKLGTAVVQQADRIKASDITDLGLVFKPDDNASGNNYASFQFQVVDDGIFGNGSENVDPTPNTIKFNVTAVNDGAPVLTGTAAVLAAGTEGVAYTIKAVDLLSGFTDADNDLLSVTGLVAGNGALVNNNDGTWTFNPQANYSGAVKLDYTVTDGKGGNTTATNTFNLAGVNDAPLGTNKTIMAIEDTAIALRAADFGFSDVENNAFLSVTIVTTTTKGSLMLDGVKVTDQQSITVDKFAGLSFIAAKDQFGKAYDSFTFKVRDGGGGTDTDPIANIMTFDVDAAIDRFIGTRGKDKQVGTDGDDYFDTKSGNDLLTGKLGQDIFVFKTGHDRDVITDFNAIGTVQDTLDIRKLNSIVNFKDLMANHADQVGRNVVIDGLNGDMITLKSVKLRDLDAADFLF